VSNVLKLSVVVAVFLTGCSVKTIDNEFDNKNNEVVKVVEEPTVDDKINSITAIDNNGLSSETNSNDTVSATSLEGSLNNVYFAFDKFNISSDMSGVVSNNANKIKSSNLNNHIKLEGNCDEWGTDEYNYALGLKRAKSTKENLVANGIDSDKIQLVSFGESNPVCSEKGPACNKQNRRVEFKVLP
jgi:peptidoglycan-associated lipoprotein